MKRNLLQKLICLSMLVGMLWALSGVMVIGSQQQLGDEPRLLVTEDNDGASLSVEAKATDGIHRRVLLRKTKAPVQVGARGLDPAGRAMFVDWSEESERWFSYSRDGQIWSEPRRIDVTLQLRDGIIRPEMQMPAVPSAMKMSDAGRLFLVQFRTVSLPEWRQALEEMGAKILGYLPHNAHIVRLPSNEAARLASLPFVQRIEMYHPYYRLDRELRELVERAETTGIADTAQFRVNVLAFEWGPDAKNHIAEQAVSLGARVSDNPSSGQLLELWVDQNQLKQTAALDDVMWIDRWSPPEEDMNLVREDSGANFLEKTTGRCGQGVRGEVMDGGIDQTHQDFEGLIMRTAAPVDSHGTSTYGITFGNGNRDGDGIFIATSHLPCAQGIFASFTTLGANRFAHTQQLKQAPFFGSFQSNSWGNTQTTSYTSISNQMDDLIWRLDIAICQSQSNTGNRNSRPQAWAKNIISVGGIRHRNTPGESDDAWANGASIGPAADGRVKPDLNYWYDAIAAPNPNNTYVNFSGTSAATPEVAGVLGLMLQMWSENVWGTNPEGNTVFERQPHASTIKALLINNAKQYPFSGTGHDLTRVHQGWGRPNLRLAMDRADNSFIVNESTPLSLDERARYFIRVLPNETELKVTMVFPDPPGTPSASVHRINDLSLQVTSPSRIIYHGNNGLLSGNFSTSGGSPNTIDTVENVFINSPEPGLWAVDVRADEINQDAFLQSPEPDAVFALVVTGGRLSPIPIPHDLFETSNLFRPFVAPSLWAFITGRYFSDPFTERL
jgi:subtilisin family serine protease